MKKMLVLILIFALLLNSCGISPVQNDTSKSDFQQNSHDNNEPQFESLADADLPAYLSNEIYAQLVNTLDDSQYFIESIETKYVSKEYIEEVAFNSQANIFFGYTLEELNDTFQGQKYVFTLGKNGQTEVREFQKYDDTYDQIIKNVVIGAGVILICATVAIITKNPATSVTAGKTIKMVFTASSMGAKAGTSMALKAAAFEGTISAFLEALKTNDFEEVKKAFLLGASDGFKWGAILGTVSGIADGIRVVENSRYFPAGSVQAAKYPEGIEFTMGTDGNSYPRFEKYAKATAKFEMPTLEAATNHTGLSGNYYWDSKLANAMCGFLETPEGYVWHHVEDMKTLLLVPQDLHSVAMGGMSHTGGASLIKTYLEELIKNGTAVIPLNKRRALTYCEIL